MSKNYNYVMENLISVIIPFYNHKQYIEKALKSAISQTYRNIEILIIDDGSSPEESEYVSKLLHIDERITYKKKENGGLSSARNFGIENSKGNLIAFLDADDEWHYSKLTMQHEAISKDESIGIVSCYSEVIDKYSKSKKWKFKNNASGCKYPKILESDCIGGGSVPLARKKCFEEVGLFDEDLKYREDWDMWIRILKKYNIQTVKKALVYYRRDLKNMSVNYTEMKEYGEKVLDKAKFEDNKIASEKVFNRLLALNAASVMRLAFKDGQYLKSKDFLLYSLKKDLKSIFTNIPNLSIAIATLLIAPFQAKELS